MPYLTNEFDLKEWDWGPEELGIARAFAKDFLEKDMPDWLQSPRGVLGRLWVENTDHSNCRLTHLFLTARRLCHYSTGRSLPRIASKLREIFEATTEDRFEELFTEFAVCDIFGLSAGPIDLEPLVTDEAEHRGEPEKSPDGRVRFSDSAAFVEVTVLRIKGVRQWSTQLELIRKEIERLVVNSGLQRRLHLSAPLGVDSNAFTRQKREELRRMLVEQASNDLVIAAGVPLRVRWAPMPVVYVNSEGDFGSVIASNPGPAIVATPGVVVGAAVSSSVAAFPDELLYSSALEDRIAESIRRVLGEKLRRRQIPEGDTPTIVVLRILTRLIPDSWVTHVLQRTIFREHRFRRVAGVAVYRDRAGCRRDVAVSHIDLQLNPHATVAAPSDLRAVFANQVRFYDGRRLPGPATLG